MKWNSKPIEMKYKFISKITGLFSILFLVGAALFLLVHGPIWLITILSIAAGVLICISLSLPGILIIIRRPNIAFAWRNGRFPLFSGKPWELLSNEQKRSIYFESMFTLFFVIAFIVWIISGQ